MVSQLSQENASNSLMALDMGRFVAMHAFSTSALHSQMVLSKNSKFQNTVKLGFLTLQA